MLYNLKAMINHYSKNGSDRYTHDINLKKNEYSIIYNSSIIFIKLFIKDTDQFEKLPFYNSIYLCVQFIIDT